jgi:hypothetical protein
VRTASLPVLATRAASLRLSQAPAFFGRQLWRQFLEQRVHAPLGSIRAPPQILERSRELLRVHRFGR